MPRVTHVKKSLKPVPQLGLPAGSSYYWWKFKKGGKRYSLTPPKRSQLTQSAFYGALYDLQDDVINSADASADLASVRDSVVETLNEIMDQCQESLDNMPEGLQQGSVGELLQERVDAMQSAIDEFEGLELDEWEASEGSEVLDEQQHEDEDDSVCAKCGKADRHALECEHNVEAERVNDDGETEQEYYEVKLEEFQAVCVEAP